jgi:ribosomal protein S18 acetylase RimI-like enzyme
MTSGPDVSRASTDGSPVGPEGHKQLAVVTDVDKRMLDAVIALGRVNAKTLGFLPAGAFEERAANGQVLVVLQRSGALAGYLVYRVAGQHASIIQLCVHADARGQGVARTLVRHLRGQVAHLQGISLRCRIDYPAHALWPRLGFKEVSQRRGRSRAGRVLAQWWLDFGHKDLFTLPSRFDAQKVCAVLDMNVLVALEADDASDEEVQGLRSDWIGGELSWCLTPEARVEIDRDDDPKRRSRLVAVARGYETLPVDAAFDECEAQLREFLFPANHATDLSESDQSDVRHLAYAASSGAAFFLTRDAALLAKAEDIEARHGISVVRPGDFVSHLDRLVEGARYRPELLQDRAIEMRRPVKPTVTVVRDWLDVSRGERKADLDRRVCRLAALPRTSHINVLVEGGRQLAVIAVDSSEENVLGVRLLRVVPGALAATLARHLLLLLAEEAVAKSRQLAVVDDPKVSPALVSAMGEMGYFPWEHGFAKVCLRGCMRPDECRDQLQDIGSSGPYRSVVGGLVSAWFDPPPKASDARWAFVVERSIWPGRLVECDIPNFVVPIRPQWAAELFDSDLASGRLFAPTQTLMLSVENVYYRSPRGSRGIKPGARILWYVAAGSGRPGQIRAVSHCIEVITGPAKDLFRQFRRLGVYRWQDVSELARRNDGQVMAIRFDRTEELRTPVSLAVARTASRRLGGRFAAPQSPLRVSDGFFREIYSLGSQ